MEHYNKTVSKKMLSLIMVKGKKNVAQRILDKTLKKGAKNLAMENPSLLLSKAVFNASPDLEIKTKKIGTNIYHIPKSITTEKKIKLGIRNILDAAKIRKEHTMVDRLAAELIDSFNYKGGAIKKKEEMHKIAESNKSFAHFNW